MSDRAALIEAIRAHPEEDLPRLEYADWLQENGESDLDAATEEFIRLSCSMRASVRMPKAVYPWLLSKRDDGLVTENWVRLLPSVLAISTAHEPTHELPVGVRRGRTVSLTLTLPRHPEASDGPGVRLYSMCFEFARGFLSAAVVYSPHAADVILDALHADQPLVDLHVPGAPRASAQVLYERLRRVAGPDEASRFLARLP